MNKSLEALERLKNTLLAEGFWQDALQDAFIIEQELKALEIIKNKKVNLEFLKCSENYEQYCLICSYGNEISKEEYNLLKEVLL